MSTLKHETVLADMRRIKQWCELADTKKDASRYTLRRDSQGVPWWAYQSETNSLALHSLSKNCWYDSCGRERELDVYENEIEAARRLTDVDCEQRLSEILRNLKLGTLALRLLWAIHANVFAAQNSLFQISDRSLQFALWRGHAVPKQWRRDTRRVLNSIGRFHLLDSEEDEPRDGTSLLPTFRLLKASDPQTCHASCTVKSCRRHSHLLISVGPGFLGDLERLGSRLPPQRNLVLELAAYGDSKDQKRHKDNLLSQAGQGGNLTELYLPSVLTGPKAETALTHEEVALLHVILRERTRSSENRIRGVSARPAIVQDGLVPPVAADLKTTKRENIQCPLLDAKTRYVSFNGNRSRKGRGYKTSTWLDRSGHQSTYRFLTCLETLGAKLGLYAVAISPRTNGWYSLGELIVKARRNPRFVGELHLRIYAVEGYLAKWNTFFDWSVEEPMEIAADNSSVAESAVRSVTLTQKAIAKLVGIDPSTFSKQIRGLRKLPDETLQNVLQIVESHRERTHCSRLGKVGGRLACSQTVTRLCRLPTHGSPNLQFAMAYLDFGWSIIPMDGKRPRIKWKPFVDSPPNASLVQDWWSRWPEAGIGLVIGVVSNTFVVDIDSEEAEQALFEHITQDRSFVTSITGSQDPFRYHLFFQHPQMRTSAKYTPWHEKLEFRGGGGLVVVPPSIHPSGGRYSWKYDHSPLDLQLGQAPEEIIRALDQKLSAKQNQTPAKMEVHPTDIDGSKETIRFLRGEYSQSAGWNDKLFKAACDLHGRKISILEAEPLLLRGAQPWDSMERERALATIESAFSSSREPSFC